MKQINSKLILLFISLIFACKASKENNVYKDTTKLNSAKIIFYPIIAPQTEFIPNLQSALKEVMEYNFSMEVILTNYIPQDSSQVYSDMAVYKTDVALICKLNSLNLYYPQKIFLRCLVFKKSLQREEKIDIAKKLLEVKEQEYKSENKKTSYDFFDLYLDFNLKEDLEYGKKIISEQKQEKVFLIEHLFFKQENFLLVIKEKFAAISKKFLLK